MKPEEKQAAIQEIHQKCGGHIYEFDSSIEQDTVSAQHVMGAYIYRQPQLNTTSDAHFYEAYLPVLKKIFEEQNGSIVNSRFCKGVPAGAILTSNNRLHVANVTPTPNTQEIHELHARAEILHWECMQYLNLTDQKYCSEFILSAMTHLFAMQDKIASGEAPNTIGLKSVSTELDRINKIVISAAERYAQIIFFFGMLPGVGIMALLAILVSLLSFSGILLLEQSPLWAASLLFGSLGAAVSVMIRMRDDKLRINYQTGIEHLRLFGIFRPVLGSIFGIVIFGLVNGKLLPITIPQEVITQYWFFCTLGFIAGFSERWAQDMLAKTGLGVDGHEEGHS